MKTKEMLGQALAGPLLCSGGRFDLRGMVRKDRKKIESASVFPLLVALLDPSVPLGEREKPPGGRHAILNHPQ